VTSKPKQVAIGSGRLNLRDFADAASKTTAIATAEEMALQMQIDAARRKPDLAQAIRDALPKR